MNYHSSCDHNPGHNYSCCVGNHLVDIDMLVLDLELDTVALAAVVPDKVALDKVAFGVVAMELELVVVIQEKIKLKIDYGSHSRQLKSA